MPCWSPFGSVSFINGWDSCIILCSSHCYSQPFRLCTVNERHQTLVIKHHSSRWWITSPVEPNPTPDIVPSLTGVPVTSETTFINSPLIINVEGGDLAFDLARHCGALYLARRRKLLLIYEDMVPLCVTSYITSYYPRENSQYVHGSHAVVSGTHLSKIHAANNINKGTLRVYSVGTVSHYKLWYHSYYFFSYFFLLRLCQLWWVLWWSYYAL